MIYPLRKAIEFTFLPLGLFVVFSLVCDDTLSTSSILPVQTAVTTEVPQPIPPNQQLRRRPVAGCFNESESVLLVANGRSGTISAIEADGRKVFGEWKVGESLTDLVRWRDDQFLAVDSAAGQLICIDFADAKEPVTRFRCATVAWPNKIVVDHVNNRCFVGGLWSRQLCMLNLPKDLSSIADIKLDSANVVNLPFSAGAMCLFDGKSIALLVLDAFSSRWSTYDPVTLQLIGSGRNRSRRSSSVAVHPENGDLCMTEQTLNHLAHAIRNDVHWGIMLGNNIRSYSRVQFVEPAMPLPGSSEETGNSWILSGESAPLGGASDAKADPESIIFSRNGAAIITLGGVDQVAVGMLDEHSFKYYPTGRRPVASAVTSNNKHLFVCNNLDDSVTIIDLRDREIETTVSLGKLPEATQADLGERLFFDGRVSHDGWMSCHSCHVNGHSNGFLNDNLGDQSFGAPKRVLSLLGHAETAPFAWNGSFETLHDQIRSSIVNTMQADEPPTDEAIDSIVAFVNSLSPPAGVTQSRLGLADESLAAVTEPGRALFMDLGCATCHSPDQHWTTSAQYDVGLTDELGKSQFNPPSLIGVGQQSAFFHDARYENLADVFRKGKHRLERGLSDDELQSLLTFLNSL